LKDYGENMRVAIGTDHAGFPLKNIVMETVRLCGREVLDLGIYEEVKADYPDYAQKVGEAIISGSADRGILLCGTGIGVCIAANKISGIYASVCHDTYSAHQGVEHDGMNVLCMGGRIIGTELAKEIVKAFLFARFIEGDNYIRRVNKIKAIESKY
jgi:RpiB/LacA/LacB family sugar-phosphate isomerase